jgi:hypothetical protein
MPVKKVFACLCLLCLLMFGALAARSAGAAESTAVECTTTGTQIPGTEKFSDAHCKSKSPSGSFFHAATPVGTKTASQLTNVTTAGEKESLFFKYTFLSQEVIIQAKTVSASATVENNLSGSEMYSELLTNSIVLEEVEVTNRACTFTGVNPGGTETVGKVETQPIRGSTKGQAAGVMTFEPQAGESTKWFEFKLSGASCPELFIGSYPVLGKVLSSAAEGATIPLNHETITTEPAPKLRLKSGTGAVTGLAGKFTLKKSSGGVPIAFTEKSEGPPPPPKSEETAVECTSTGTQIPGTEKFSDAHCKTKNSSGSFFHAATPLATNTASELSNNTTESGKEPGFLKATIGGLETIIEAKTITASGTITNLESGTEMFAEGKTSTVKFSEVTVTNRPCTFTGVNPGGTETVGSVETQPIAASTKGQAAGVVLVEPQGGPSSKFAEFKLSGASCPEALIGTYPAFGTFLSSAAEGATIPFLHTTVTGEPAPKLRLKNATTGPVAGLAGKITPKKTSGGVPIALT